MKAKEYTQAFKAERMAGTDKLEATGRIIMGLIKEFIETGEARHCQTDAAFLGLWREIETKWRRICDMLPEEHFKPDGIGLFMQSAYPELWAALEIERRQQEFKRKLFKK